MRQSDTASDARKRWSARDKQTDESPWTVGVAASFTAEPFEPYVGAALAQAGVANPAIAFADYNQISQICLNPSAYLQESDVVVFLWRIEDLFEESLLRCLEEMHVEAHRDELISAAGDLGALIGNYCDESGKPVVVSTPPLPVGFGIDHNDSSTSAPLRQVRHAVEVAFLTGVSAASSPPTIFDLCGLQTSFGVEPSFDSPKWLLYHQPYSVEFLHHAGTSLAHCLVSLSRPSPKVLALDCDNTLWGGIVGEDGIGGIDIGQSFPGSAFREFQLVARRLQREGILLAIVSKNNAADVEEVFENHDEMVLQPDDIAAWRVNWEPKPDNLRSIAEELNLGLDSFVFVDDSDHEISAVRSQLPEVVCLQVPEDEADLPELIAQFGLFQFRRQSAEDRSRTTMMLQEKQRSEATESMSKEDFQKSLALEVEIFAVGDEHIGRVAQLTNKTNQFNLTTVRRTEADIASLVAADDRHVFGLRVSDRFGDYGLVGVSILEDLGENWDVDTLLMSCRVLGRGVETALISHLVDFAAEHGASSVVGRYEPTLKNAQVADLYPKHGFSETDEDGTFTIDAAEPPAAPDFLTIKTC